jgi:DNA-binding transcriptional ArsR family regulator
MSESNGRLRRLLESDVSGCCDSDIDDRRAELDSLRERAFVGDTTRDRAALSALGDETRYRLIRLLAATDDPLCVCELEPLVDVSESAVSHALSDLVDAGLVTRSKAGRWRYYGTTARARAVLDALDETRGVA